MSHHDPESGASAAGGDPVYEMLWDCPYCGQDKLLGLTHRHCPGCGAPQDPARRYFPDESEKVAVADHRYVGADLVCANCGAPCSAAAAHCGRCGALLGDDDARVERKVQAPPVPPPTPARPRGRGKAIAVRVAVIVCIVLAVLAVTWKSEESAVVAGHAWMRSIDIERFQTVQRENWCDALPGDARVLSRASRQRGTRRVPDGESCQTRNVDNGDGTFRQVRECTPRYREEPVYAQHCRYTVERWVREREAVARGVGLQPPPSWPATDVDRCRRLGCTREGARRERYALTLRLAEGESTRCDLPRARWRDIADGSRWTLPVGVITGAADCARMRPAP